MIGRTSVAGLLILALAACSLPRSGPSHQRVLHAAGTEKAPTGITVIHVNEQVIRQANTEEPLHFGAGFLGRSEFAADRIAAGDSLLISVFENVDAPLLGETGRRMMQLPVSQVDRQGNIFLPYVGTVHAAGLTTDDLRRKITEGLETQTPQPQVVVERSAGKQDSVTIVGTVAKQGLVPLEPQVNRLAAVIAAAGGSTVATEVTVVTVLRGPSSAEIRLDDLFLSDRFDIALRPGDRIVLREDGRTLSVFGASGQQGQLGFSGRHYSLTDALAAAGGLIAQRAYPKGVFVYRILSAGPERQEVVYHFDLAEVQGTFFASQFFMRDGDVIYISEAPFTNFSRSLEAIRGTANAGTSLAGAGQ